MFGSVRKFSYRSSETKNTLGRKLKIQERLKSDSCPVYQIIISQNKKVERKVNFSQVELISIYFLWGSEKHREFQSLKRKIVKRARGFVIYHFSENIWNKRTEIEFTEDEEKYFLRTVKTLLEL